MSLNESTVEDAMVERFGELSKVIGHGPLFAPGEAGAEHDSLGDMALAGWVREAQRRLNLAVAAVNKLRT